MREVDRRLKKSAKGNGAAKSKTRLVKKLDLHEFNDLAG
jgi:hypothetical protein